MGFANARTPRERQRAQTVTEILDAALAQMERDGVAALNLTEVAARVGLAQPSLYRYFPSRAAVYDALFARGMTMHRDLLRATADSAPPGWPAVQAMMRVTVGFAADNPTLAQLLFVRVVPGFTPSRAAYAPSVQAMHIVRDGVASAVTTGELTAAAATNDGIELLVTLTAGVMAHEEANNPKERTHWLLPVVLEMYRHHYRPDSPAPTHDA